MNSLRLLVSCVLISRCWSTEEPTFPPWFKFGVATAAYQVEGAWNVSDKGEGDWDRLFHVHPELKGHPNGDVACDSYHLWRRDIEMLEELGVDMYRFSISWPRLLPTGFPNHISQDGKNYYNNLIDGLVEKGIEPLITLYHFDMPQSLQDLGGWANPLIVNWFEDYARVVYTLFADRVKIFVTVNEPFIICELGYSKGHVPYHQDQDVGRFLCNKNTLLAHAKAWRLYDEEFRPLYHGKVSLSNLFIWFEPATPADKELTELALEHWEGRYGHPIYSKEGGWPLKIQKFLNDKAMKEGYPYPRMIPFTPEEIELVRGTYDFYGLNHYTTFLARRARPGEKIGRWPLYGSEELGMVMEGDPSWTTGEVDWFTMHPEGVRRQLHWLNDTYGVKEIIITENGYIKVDKQLNDWSRLKYTKDYLEQILLAINDGINVTGYTHWSLMDNFEWMVGYNVNFGLYSVDFKDPNRTRTPRESARYYSKVTRSRSVNHRHIGLNYV
ncbi:unnamed protein product [Spodoptera littoralis]|uniref:Myrosinase 1-like n=1 Tax=Spodoptera littoralis TaxID=7109 RepID=A0A9P0N438_SPOLI|nr:unnamed protein product [Spodoptera littoralis]CAH1640814.1 unnamed protein product [Spodoptera littoralis]